ncbi:MAG: carbamoyltransferase HypF [Actinomycetota bacterium]|nr:carbamoyltransferase HypF [Actinomycetota bacterium]
MSTATAGPGRSATVLDSARTQFSVTGVVQGVGFRPFVHRLATELGLTGFVGNDAHGVFGEIQGPLAALAVFERRLVTEAPPLSVVTGVRCERVPTTPATGFTIVASVAGTGLRSPVSPDMATCDACLDELRDPANRRYRHPFITCTDCGPRFTIITDLPYDRPATTMAGFTMCIECAREYDDADDRRFHAQPIACPDCGPRLRFEVGTAAAGVGDASTLVYGVDAAIEAAQLALIAGKIVAIKGVGGYHLACRADDTAALRTLRARKARNDKPFALLARDVGVALRLVHADADELAVLAAPARPIVLLRRRADAGVLDAVAPGNPLLGVMLAYTPIHHLLLAPVPGSDLVPLDVLVMTSANISEEPLCFDDRDARDRLPLLADAVLTHDRPIHVPCDDSVVRVLDGHELPIRRSRGYAPMPIALPRPLPPTLAVGAELKNSCCLIDGTNAYCSAHVGDMGNLDTLRAFERAVEHMSALYQVRPVVVAADAHPAYLTRGWAERHAGGPGEAELRFVQHHHAHVVSLLADHGRVGTAIVGVAFDGTGYGDDAAVWGGEILLVGADTATYRRAGHLLAVDLPGGDLAVRNPCRMALAYLASAGVDWDADLAPVIASQARELAAVRAQLTSGAGSSRCTSMGRLFDAVASILGLRHRIGYEAQAAIELEVLAGAGRNRAGDFSVAGNGEGLAFAIDDDNIIDYRPVVRALVAGRRAGVPADVLAYAFHAAIADAVAECSRRIAATSGVRLVGLTGGVFQNVLLLQACRERLVDLGLEVLVHRQVPPNDAGLALGQAVIGALAHLRDRSLVRNVG